MNKLFMKIISLTICLLFVFQTTAFSAEEIFFYHTDPAGTPLAMSDMSGKKVWEADYKPFGEEYSVDGSEGNSKRFVGKEKDEETGLDYFDARYLSPESGRFLTPDPVRAVDEKTGKINLALLAEPQRQNVYAYSLNNPYRYVDKDGECVIALSALIFAGVIAILSVRAANEVRREIESRSYWESPQKSRNFVLNEENDQKGKSNDNEATFPDEKELAKKLGVTKKGIHGVKDQIKTDHPEELKKIGSKNPDIGYTKDGEIVFKGRNTGKTVKTGSKINDYKGG